MTAGVDISLERIGKRFGREWIFRNVDLNIAAGERLAILGGNGSGKSTLLQVISSYITPAEGKVMYSAGGKELDTENIHSRLSLAAPYLQLPEELTALELAEHISLYKKFTGGLNPGQVLENAYLQDSADKFIRQFSSGMKQRLKLALAFYCESDAVLLDEPLSNLDRKAIEWYRSLVLQCAPQRTVIICSNSIEEEIDTCKRRVNVEEFKNVSVD